MYYVSHPFTGCNENKNRKSCRSISAKLSELYPHILFINPLDTFRHLEKINLTYNDILNQCIELLDKCDGIIMCGDYRCSTGCMQEFVYSKEKHIEVYTSVDNFTKGIKL